MKFKDAPSRARRIVEEDDVIVSTVRTYLKAIAVIPSNNKPIIVSTGFITLKAKKDVLPKFLKYLALQEKFISQVQSRSCGVSYPAINSSDVISIKVPVPTIEIQKEIVDFLEQKCDFINNIIKEKEIFINQLEEYKKSLIYEYVTGKKQLN